MNLDKTLKVLIFISLLILLLTVLRYRLDSCALCRFEIEGKEVKLNSFWETYKSKCIDIDLETNITNLPISFPGNS
jgi:hypothetical protein